MFTPARSPGWRRASSAEARSRAKLTNGGSSEREAKLDTVVPCGRPSRVIAVTTVTGEHTPLISSRNVSRFINLCLPVSSSPAVGMRDLAK
jgi:hypothetical protein